MDPAAPGVLAEYGLMPPATAERHGDGVWLVRNGGETLVLREMKRQRTKADFTLRALEHVLERGFRGLPAWRRAVDGRLAVCTGRSTWLLSELVPGHGALLGLEPDALATAAALGSLHCAATGLSGDDEPDSLDPYLRQLARCRDRVKSLRTYVLMAKHKLRRTAMDRAYLEAVAAVLPLAETALERLECSDWMYLARASKEQGAFVYRRIGRSGVVVTDQSSPRAVFVDWSGCRRDCQLTDVGRLVGRVTKSSGGDPALARAAIAAYHRERPMSPDEQSILPLLLTFPDRFCALARRYYEHKRDWPENTFVRHLRREMQNHQAQLSCVRELTTVQTGG